MPPVRELVIGLPVHQSAIAPTAPALGRGGQGSVYPTRLRSAGRPVVYKEYGERIRPTVDVDVLNRMIAVVADAVADERDALLARCAWPMALVAHGTHVVGFLMPQVPGAFSVRLLGGHGARPPVLAQFQHLLNSPKFLRTKGIAISRADQFLLLADVADAITALHRRNVCVGDLSPMNLLFTLNDGAPAAYFIDCDAMVIDGRSVSAQAETPSWEAPAGEPLGTRETDAFKFGLLVLRLLAGDQTTRDPGRLPAEADLLRPLLERTLAAMPEERPRPDDWLPSLLVAARRASTTLIGDSAGVTDAEATEPPEIPDEKPTIHDGSEVPRIVITRQHPVTTQRPSPPSTTTPGPGAGSARSRQPSRTTRIPHAPPKGLIPYGSTAGHLLPRDDDSEEVDYDNSSRRLTLKIAALTVLFAPFLALVVVMFLP